jgi:wobble nucleotide-excising tRNase
MVPVVQRVEQDLRDVSKLGGDMLLRVDQIDNLGRFGTLKQKSPQFSELTLVFARNGHGKSTVGSTLRSLAEQDANIMHARQRLGAAAPTARLTWNGHGPVTFGAAGWDDKPHPVFVFDREFVRRNVHIGESVTRMNKRNLLYVVVGEERMKLAAEITALDLRQRELNTERGRLEQLICVGRPVITDVASFVNAPDPEDMDSKIQGAERELQLATQAKTVVERQPPSMPAQPPLSVVQALAERRLENVADDAALAIEAHLAAHKMEVNGTRWLKYGVDHMVDEYCPFCTQDTRGVPLVQVFKSHFSEAFGALIAETQAALGDWNQFRAAMAPVSERHTADAAYWGAVCDLGGFLPISPAQSDEILAAVDQIIATLQSKLENPAKAVTIGDAALVAGIFERYEQYAAELEPCLALIATAKAQAAQSDIQRAKAHLERLQAWKARGSEPLATHVKGWRAVAKELEDIPKRACRRSPAKAGQMF